MVDDNLVLVRLLHIHGADINMRDADSWTPLHAAAANGYHEIVTYLLSHGADRNKRTEDGEMAEDLVEEEDFDTMAVFQTEVGAKEEVEKLRRLSHVVMLDTKEKDMRKAPAWVRRMSLQEARKEVIQEAEPDTRRKGSAWIGKEEIPEEEESDDEDRDEEASKSRVDKSANVGQPSVPLGPGLQRISTTTIIVSKDKDESVKLKEPQRTEMKEGCNSKSKEEGNTKTTRQRRRGRLELSLSEETLGVTSPQFLTAVSPQTQDTSKLSVSLATENPRPTMQKPKMLPASSLKHQPEPIPKSPTKSVSTILKSTVPIATGTSSLVTKVSQEEIVKTSDNPKVPKISEASPVSATMCTTATGNDKEER